MKSIPKLTGLALCALAGAASAIGGYRQLTAAPVAAGSAPAAAVAVAKASANLVALQPALAASLHRAQIDDGLAREMQTLGAGGTVGLFVHFTSKQTAQQDALLQSLGVAVITDFRKYTDAIFVTGNVASLLKLATDPSVYRLEWNEPLEFTNHTANWAMRNRVAQETVGLGPYYDPNGKILDGSGVGVAVVDSGTDGRHPDFALALNGGRNYKAVCSPVGVGACIGQFVDVGITGTSDTSSGHGHHVAGTILGSGAGSLPTYTDAAGTPVIKGAFAGVAPAAKLYAFGTGEAIAVLFAAQSYQYLLDNMDNRTMFPTPVRVTNNSYGNAGGTAYAATNTLSQLVKRIVEEKKVIVAFAAGNDGDGTVADTTSGYCKDPTPGVICVASYDDLGSGSLQGVLSSFTSQGAFTADDTTAAVAAHANYPDVAAPGSNITSACTAALPICKDTGGGDTAYLPNYGTISGTSMATPHVVGAIALLLQARPDLTPEQVEKVLQKNARKLVDNTYGAAQAAYQKDPQHPEGSINYRAGAGLVDLPATLDALGVAKRGTLPAAGETTVISGDANATGGADSGSMTATANTAKDFVKLTMKDEVKGGVAGIGYALTVANATALGGAAAVRYQVLQNVDGKSYSTGVTLAATGLTADGVGASTSAPATSASVSGNELRFFVPLGALGAPPVGAPVHNIRINVHAPVNGMDSEVDYAPSRGSVGDSQATAPGWGRPYTVLAASTPLLGNRCEIPGLTVVSDAGGDAMTTASQDLLSASIAQPFVASGDPRLVFTIKVAELGTLTAGSGYYVSFKKPDGTFGGVRMEVVNPTAPAFFTYVPSGNQDGGVDGRFVDTQVAAEAGSRYDAATGVITIVAKPSAFGLTAGQALSGFNGGVTQSSDPGVGIGGATLVTDEMPDGLGRVGEFAYVSNLVCAPNTVPVARLTADRTEGGKPLAVAFSGLTSSDADVGDSVTSYTFTFGDEGSLPVTNATGKVSHTYARSGTYTATLKVADTKGAVSTTLATLVISATNAAPTVTLAASRTGGDAPLAVDFTATGADANTDDAAALAYSYDLDGDGSYEVVYGSATQQSHTFSEAGDYTVKVKVKDLEGLETVGMVLVKVTKAVAQAVAPFTFLERTDVKTGTFITSEVVTLSGFTGTLPISVSGPSGASAQYSVNGGPFTATAGTVKAGDRIAIRHVSDAAEGKATTSTITVGSYSTPFKTVTTTLDHVPAAFDFGSQSNVAPGTLVESPVLTLTAYDDAPVVAGPGQSYRINGGAWTTARGTLKKGDTVQVRHTTNTASLGYTKSTLTVGGVKGTFTTRTRK